MPSWWGKSSSKEAKKKAAQESSIDALQKKCKNPESKSSIKSGVSNRQSRDKVSERISQSRAESRSSSPSKHVARCQSFVERPVCQPLPLPCQHPKNIRRTNSVISESAKPKLQRVSKPSLFPLILRPACIRRRMDPTDFDGELAVASISSICSVESDDQGDSHQHSPLANDYDIVSRIAAGSPSSHSRKDLFTVAPVASKESPVLVVSSSIPRRRHLNRQVPNIQVPRRDAIFSAPDSSISSPSRSPISPFLGSGQCSSPCSGQTSGHNSMGGDMAGQLFWHSTRVSPEYSPNPSPRLRSPGPSSRIHSGAVTPLHPRDGGGHSEPQSNWPDDVKQQSHRLPLPPIKVSNSSPFSRTNSAATSPSVQRSFGRADNLANPSVSRWKKGKMLCRGTFGDVFVGFNRETGEMCAMKEVTLFADDAKSKESAKQLGQEIALLSRLKHPNIVQYYGSETMDDKLYIYLEYVSAGSIHKILQEYGALGESAIRSYTQQILSGLAYLHAKNTVHRDIKGANILVDPSGRVKLADFGMAKHITGKSSSISLKGSPYWMAPEVIRNSNGCSLAVDIWSLGCTVLEMATSKPPWSQYEGVAAMFKIGNSKELPAIPDHLSDEGKEFVRLCLQRNPLHRPTAAQLLEHSFVKIAAPLEKQASKPSSSDHPALTNAVKYMDTGNGRSHQHLDTKRLDIPSPGVSKNNFHFSDIYIHRNMSSPVSPIGSPSVHGGRMSPSPICSPRIKSGASTPPSSRNLPTQPHHKRPVQQQQPGSHAFRGQQLYDGPSVLADTASSQQQLTRDPTKRNPSHDLSPTSPLTYHRMI
ncbi:hypothetical protein ABFX02_06G032400 [Erythranthe guttata]